MAAGKLPKITDEKELQIWTCWNPETATELVKWHHFTPDDEAYIGKSHQGRFEITLDEFAAGLRRISDDAIFPEVPAGTQITTAPNNLDGAAVYIKRSGLKRYGMLKGDDCGAKEQMLGEALVMEKISKTPHPYIVRYHGCRVHRGRITGIVLEKLGDTLNNYAYCEPDEDEPRSRFEQIDKEAFLAGVESAIKFLHSLGLAHNDISPYNILVREAGDGSCMPVLIDFDSCGPFGGQLLSLGTAGFFDAEDKECGISHKKHDEFALKRLSEWWDKEHSSETHPFLGAIMEEAKKKQEDLEGSEDEKE
ncbi:kinase-like domain-containing protein [Parachaetomium inaequale]|uniref:Kinase-like domain-containing protein n=1 Tax=Parachaetomium inaequale TaxID=2588326 RepID=A0AAN6PDR6_9PEZI|nr:kinase-like domain-containing protein [Parachaetomium inaequale]